MLCWKQTSSGCCAVRGTVPGESHGWQPELTQQFHPVRVTADTSNTLNGRLRCRAHRDDTPAPSAAHGCGPKQRLHLLSLSGSHPNGVRKTEAEQEAVLLLTVDPVGSGQ